MDSHPRTPAANAHRPVPRARSDVKLNAGGMFGNGRNLDKSIYVKPGPKYAERWGRNSKVIKENKVRLPMLCFTAPPPPSYPLIS